MPIVDALRKIDVILPANESGAEQFRKGNPTVETVIPDEAEEFGFEKLDPAYVAPPGHSLTAFEQAGKRYAIDLVRRKHVLGRAVLRGFGFSPEELVVKHTLDHLRKPELLMLIGIPLYDLQLAMNIAYHTARLVKEGSSTTLRLNQLSRWEERFFKNRFLENCVIATQVVIDAITTQKSFRTLFPSAKDEQSIRYKQNEDGYALVQHNLAIWQRNNPEILRPHMRTLEEQALRDEVNKGIMLPGGVLRVGVESLPENSALLKSLELFITYCTEMQKILDQANDLETLGQWQEVYERVFTSVAPTTSVASE